MPLPNTHTAPDHTQPIAHIPTHIPINHTQSQSPHPNTPACMMTHPKPHPNNSKYQKHPPSKPLHTPAGSSVAIAGYRATRSSRSDWGKPDLADSSAMLQGAGTDTHATLLTDEDGSAAADSIIQSVSTGHAVQAKQQAWLGCRLSNAAVAGTDTHNCVNIQM